MFQNLGIRLPKSTSPEIVQWLPSLLFPSLPLFTKSPSPSGWGFVGRWEEQWVWPAALSMTFEVVVET